MKTTLEQKLKEVSETFFARSMDKGALQIIKLWSETPTDQFSTWFFATDMLDYHGWERRGNRKPFDEEIQKAIS